MSTRMQFLSGPTLWDGERHIDPQSEVPEWPDKKKGDSRLRCRTGKLMWAFHTVPQPGEVDMTRGKETVGKTAAATTCGA